MRSFDLARLLGAELSVGVWQGFGAFRSVGFRLMWARP